ncbi:TPA: hypothetical protein QEL68_000698 [Stenotrophomonas maltophilia]|nr:hypothetical protein [Stenotrophomonas maltophilia]
MVDYTDGTLNALAGGFNFGRMVKDARDEQQFNRLAQLSYEAPQEQRQSLLGQMAAISPRAAQQQEQSFASADERRNTTMVNMAKLLTSAPEQARPALWQRFIPTLSQFGLSQLPTEYNAETAPVIDQAAQSLVQAYGGGVGGNVQSTYIDGNGNRVAIMRDGSQRVLGPNNASIRVMEQEGALPYGVVTSGGRPGAVVDIGGAQVPAQGATGQYTIDPSLPPEVQQQIRAAEAAGQQVPSNMVLPPRSGPVRVPTAAEKAGASEVARLEAQQRYLPDELAMRTQAAIQQAGGSAQAKGEAEARLEAVQNLPRVMQESTNAINLINQALNHPGLATAVGASGRADPRNYIPGTDATDFRVLLDQIKGGTFLQAFQSLKGGGAITEVEGTKAEQAIARLNRDQSEAAFRQSLQDLRDVAQAAITRAQTKAQAAGGSPAPMPAQGAPRQIQSAAEYNALPSGALFIAPDGSQRRKR